MQMSMAMQKQSSLGCVVNASFFFFFYEYWRPFQVVLSTDKMRVFWGFSVTRYSH